MVGDINLKDLRDFLRKGEVFACVGLHQNLETSWTQSGQPVLSFWGVYGTWGG